MTKPRLKNYQEQTVWEASLDRINYIYELADDVVVSVSGGKDSSATLFATIEVARKLGRLPVKAIFNDEECIPQETVDYMQALDAMPEIELTWLCLPFQLRNACSKASPFWWTWAPEDKERWCRPLPEAQHVITELEGVTDVARNERPGFPESVWRLIPPGTGTVAMLLGIRADESLMRHQQVTNRTHENYLWSFPRELDPTGRMIKGVPIYDWMTEDLWTAARQFGWPMNKAYNQMEMLGIPHTIQRCSPAFGEEPLRKLSMFAECFPDIWARMQDRVPGVGAAYRYSNTSLWAFNTRGIEKPLSMTWGEWFEKVIKQHDPEIAIKIRSKLAQYVKRHLGMTADPILPIAAHPQSGLSWRYLIPIATRGDLKSRRQTLRGSQEEWDKEYHELEAAGILREMTEW